MPSLSVVQTDPSRRRRDAPALSSPAKPSAAVEQPVDEPFEPDRDLDEAAAEALCNAVDHRAAHHRLADAAARFPRRAMIEQIGDRCGEIMIGLHQAAPRVTMPWRSASVSLPNARSKRSRRPIRRAIA